MIICIRYIQITKPRSWYEGSKYGLPSFLGFLFLLLLTPSTMTGPASTSGCAWVKPFCCCCFLFYSLYLISTKFNDKPNGTLAVIMARAKDTGNSCSWNGILTAWKMDSKTKGLRGSGVSLLPSPGAIYVTSVGYCQSELVNKVWLLFKQKTLAFTFGEKWCQIICTWVLKILQTHASGPIQGHHKYHRCNIWIWNPVE